MDPSVKPKVTTVLKSKFKARLPIIKKIKNKTYRCVEFSPVYLNRIKLSYEVEDKIEIVSKKVKKEKVTPVTPVTPLDELSPNNYNEFDRENERKNEVKEGEYSSRGVTSVTSVTESQPKPKPIATCPKCGTIRDAFYMKNHIANCTGVD